MSNYPAESAQRLPARRRFSVGLAFVLVILLGAMDAAASEGGLPIVEAALELSRQIQETYVGPDTANRPKIAVLEFSDLDGHVNNVGRLLAEELITNLFVSGRFSIVERSLLNKILEEQQLAREGIVDSESLKNLGRLLGARAIVTGTLIDVGEELSISARVIATQNGEILAVARATALKDRAYQELVIERYVAKEATPSEEASETHQSRSGVGKANEEQDSVTRLRVGKFLNRSKKTSFLIYLTSDFEICDGCPAAEYPAMDDPRWKKLSRYSVPIDSVSPWFRVRPGAIYQMKYEYMRNGRVYSDKTALDPTYHAEGTEVDGVHVDWAYWFDI